MPLQFYVDSSGPDWAIHCCLVDFLKPVATISLAENSNVVGQLLKRGYLSGENCPVNFWATFLSTLGDFFLLPLFVSSLWATFYSSQLFPWLTVNFYQESAKVAWPKWWKCSVKLKGQKVISNRSVLFVVVDGAC